MIDNLRTLAVSAAAAAILVTGAAPRPAQADTTSTINTILGAAAVVGGIVLYNNYEHKKQAANSVVGYTRNGGTIYGDGRVTMPNGRTVRPNSNGQYPGGGYAYYSPQFSGATHDYKRTGQYDQTHRHGH